ncbi:MAG: Flp pilus assembly protein CpaB [Alphaproteobacteria bacterium]|nr:Flp pilus assembly protein CpaB [Alphaproteobacteria bacterium]
MESSQRLIILLVAGVIVAFAAIALRSRIDSSAPPPSNNVIVAKRDIALGTLIQPSGDLTYAPPPEGAAPETLLAESTNRLGDFTGAVVRRPLKAGEPVPPTALMKPGEGGFMSAVLEPGMRAVSVAVTATSGAAGFISPGDRVDLIVTHRIRITSGQETGNEESVVSETFVRNVRVVAVDQMLDNPENKAILAKTVTVEVDDRQAEQIAVASEMGKISMSLRSIAGSPSEDDGSRTKTTQGDVSRMLEGGAMPRVRVIRGEQVENMEFAK